MKKRTKEEAIRIEKDPVVYETHPPARCPPCLLTRFKMTSKFQTKSKEKAGKCTAMEAFLSLSLSLSLSLQKES